MFHLVCFAAVHGAFFQTVSLMFSVPLCQEYKSVLRCTEVAEVCLETCGNKEIALLGMGREHVCALTPCLPAAAMETFTRSVRSFQ